MISSKVVAGIIGATATAWLCTLAPACLADDTTSPPINASGAGMTDAQLQETRPVLSGLKSVDEAYQTIKEIQDKAHDIVRLCTNSPPVNTLGDDDPGPRLTGPFSKLNGKYYVAPKWKLREIGKTIQRQKLSLADLLSQNRQDHRKLRASEETRQKIVSLRGEARELLVPLADDINKLLSLISSASAANQSEILSTAQSLIKTCRPVESKLREMEKLLKREIKS